MIIAGYAWRKSAYFRLTCVLFFLVKILQQKNKRVGFFMDKKIRLKYPWLQKRMFPIVMRGLLYQKSGVVVAVLHHRQVAVGQDRTGADRGHPLLLSPLFHKRHAHRPG